MGPKVKAKPTIVKIKVVDFLANIKMGYPDHEHVTVNKEGMTALLGGGQSGRNRPQDTELSRRMEKIEVR